MARYQSGLGGLGGLGVGAEMFPSRSRGIGGITPEEWVALQQFLQEEEERKRGSGGGVGAWIRGAVEGGLSKTGLDKIPYFSRGAGQIAESLIWGTPGMIGHYVGGNLKDITSGLQADNPLTWLESAALTGSSLGGLLPTAGAYRGARGQDSALFETAEAMAQGVSEDVRHPLRNIGYLTMDVLGAAALAKGGMVRHRTGLGRARGAAGTGPLVPEGPRPSPTPVADIPRAAEVSAPPELQRVRERMGGEQAAQQAAIENQALQNQMLAFEAAPQRAIPALEDLQLQPEGPQPWLQQVQQAAPTGPFDLARLAELLPKGLQEPIRSGIPELGRTEVINLRRPPESPGVALDAPIGPLRPASGLIEQPDPPTSLRPARKDTPEPDVQPVDLQAGPAKLHKAGDEGAVERMLADVGELEGLLPEMGPQTPLDWAIQQVTRKFGMAQRRGLDPEVALNATLDWIINEKRMATGEEPFPIELPPLSEAPEAVRQLKKKQRRHEELKSAFSAGSAAEISNALDAIGGYIMGPQEIAKMAKRKLGAENEYTARRRKNTTPEEENVELHFRGRPTTVGWQLVDDPQGRKLYRVTENGRPVEELPSATDARTIDMVARSWAADIDAGIPPALREMTRGEDPLVRLGPKAMEEEGQEFVPLGQALEISKRGAKKRKRAERARKAHEAEQAALVEEAEATGRSVEEIAAERLTPEQQAERQRYLKETEGVPEEAEIRDLGLAAMEDDSLLEQAIAKNEKRDALVADLEAKEFDSPSSAMTEADMEALKAEAPGEMHAFLDLLSETNRISPELRQMGQAADIFQSKLREVQALAEEGKDLPRAMVEELKDPAYGEVVNSAAESYEKAVIARKGRQGRVSTRRLVASLTRQMNAARRETIEGSLTDIPQAVEGLTGAIEALQGASAVMFREGPVGRILREQPERRVPREQKVEPVEYKGAEETPQREKRAPERAAETRPRQPRTAGAGSVRQRDVREVAPGMAETEQRSIAKQIRNELDRKQEAGEPINEKSIEAAATAAGLDAEAAAALAEGAMSSPKLGIKMRKGSFSALLKDSGLSEEHIALLSEDLKELRASAKEEGRELTKKDYRQVLDELDPTYGTGTGDRVFNFLYEVQGGPNKIAGIVLPILASLGMGDITGGAAVGFVGIAGRMGRGPIVPRAGQPSVGHLAMEYLRGVAGPQPEPGFSEFTRLTETGEREWVATQPRSPSAFTNYVQGGWHKLLQEAADDVRRTELRNEELGTAARAGRPSRMGNYIWQKKVDYYSRMRERLMSPARLAIQQQMWEMEIDRIDASIDQLNLTPDQKYKLRLSYVKDFGESPMEKHAAAQKIPAEVGVLGKTMDTANQLASLMLLYLKPGYIPPNFLGQVLFTTIDHSWNPISMGRAYGVTQDLRQRYPQHDEMASLLAQAGPMEILKTERGWSRKIQALQERMADVYSGLIDDPHWAPFRRLAITNELIRRGYRTADQQALVYESIRDIGRMDELSEAERGAVAKRYTDLEHAVMEGNRNIVDYGNLGAQEKRVVRRAVLFYPWVKGATKFAGRFLMNHPIQAAIMAQLGKEAQEDVRKAFGAVPSYLEGVIPMPDVFDKVPLLSDLLGPSSRMVPGVGEVPRFINPAAMTPLGTGGEAINMARALTFGGVRQVDRPGGLLTPALSAAVAATLRVDPFFGGAIPPDVTFGDILLREFAQSNLPGQLAAGGIGALTGKTPEGLGIPGASALMPTPKSQKIESGEVVLGETLLPTTRQEELGRYLVGGIFPSSLDPRVSRERAAAEAYSMMDDVEQAKAKWKDKIMFATEAAREKGAIGPGEQLPKDLRDAVLLKMQRDVNYAEYAEATDQSEEDLDELEKLDADLQLAVRKGFLDRKTALEWRDTYARSGMVDQLRNLISDAYFGGDWISSYSDYYSQLYPGLELDFSLR